ncbi:MAG: transposase family protein [Albidovulum sp.]|nr:transposase family protein [Albidovulum sp.]
MLYAHGRGAILIIGQLRVIFGGEGIVDMSQIGRTKEKFLQRLMSLQHGIPSRDSLFHLFRAIDPMGLRDDILKLVSGWAGKSTDRRCAGPS